MTRKIGLGLCHGSCVDVDGAGVLILGASGSGKSSLVIELLALGARLVGDDQVQLSAASDGIRACGPERLRGLVEFRHVGLLQAKPVAETTLKLVVDLDQPEPDRLPPHRNVTIDKFVLQLIFGKDVPHLAMACRLLVTNGRGD